MLTALRRAVREAKHNNGVTVVLFLDGASQHLSTHVLNHAARLKIVLVLIPSQLTWLLQPLDVEVFREFKDLLRMKQTELRIDMPEREISAGERIRILGECILELLRDKTWSHAFARVGLHGSYNNLKSNIARYLGRPSDIVARALTQEELTVLVGRERANILPRFFRGPLTLIANRAVAAIADGAPQPAAIEAPAALLPESLHEDSVPACLPPAMPPEWIDEPAPSVASGAGVSNAIRTRAQSARMLRSASAPAL
jgi:hypothetical protein